MVFGITLVIMDRFNPYEFLRLVAEHKVTCFHIVPAMYTALLSLKHIEKFDLSSLRWVVVFGAPSSPEIMERFHKFCPNAQLLNGWGMTETCPPNTVTPLGSRNIASVGKPSPLSEIKILDENDNEVAVGEIGEIVIRGWIVMKEYYKDPQSTLQVKRNGWLYTGDLGRKDKEGYLYIVGRKKEMIKVAGQIVYAPEVESVFYKHDAVLDVAVIGVLDDMRGEAVKAFVVLKENSSVSAEDLRYFAREHLANFKVPQTIEIRPSLPKNRTGKIDKEMLKHEIQTVIDR
jgi:long-chain acyl-CoA synthetase